MAAESLMTLDFLHSRLLGGNPFLPHMYECAYTSAVVEWDADKAAENLRKHRVDFADAATVLEDEAALTVPDDHADEERWVTQGMDSLGRILVVVLT